MSKDIIDLAKEKLVSVVVPIYNAEAYLVKCIGCIFSQSHANVEIIVVDDASPGNVKQIVQKQIELGKRIKLISHDKNRGSYQARVTGAAEAIGDYVTFVDSDDSMGVDYFRVMLEKAIAEDADIVISRNVYAYENGYQWVTPVNEPAMNLELKDADILKSYFEQQGRTPYCHSTWGRLYKRELIEKSLPDLQSLTEHFILIDDFAFSTVLHYYAKKYVSVDYYGYRYLLREGSVTNAKKTLPKVRKDIHDIALGCDFVEGFLKKNKCYEEYVEDFQSWKGLFFRALCAMVQCSNLGKKTQALYQEVCMKMNFKEVDYPWRADNYFGEFSSPWDAGYELLKQRILSQESKYISFGLFDTLVVKPFASDNDFFELLESPAQSLLSGQFPFFSTLRKEAQEHFADDTAAPDSVTSPNTLDDIYRYIALKCDIKAHILEQIKALECKMEVQFSRVRHSVRELIELAYMAGKQIFIIADTYYGPDTVRKIVAKAGVADMVTVVSMHNIAEAPPRALVKSPHKMLYIDHQDGIAAFQKTNLGCKTALFPKATQRFFYEAPENNFNKGFQSPFANCRLNDEAVSYIGVRAMLTQIANLYFDNPFRTVFQDSDFNADPYFMGYYALGMHYFGLVKWMQECVRGLSYRRIHFLGKETYLIKQVYDKFASQYPDMPEAVYTPLSEEITNSKTQNAGYNKSFTEYLSGIIGDNDAVFDSGAQGNLQFFLHRILDKKIDAFFGYQTTDETQRFGCIIGVKTWCYESALHETDKELINFFSTDFTKDCTGYQNDQPVLRRSSNNFWPIKVTGNIRRGTLDFVTDILDQFGSCIKDVPFHYRFLSIPFMHLLNFSQEIDRNVFDLCGIDNRPFRNRAGEFAHSVSNAMSEETPVQQEAYPAQETASYKHFLSGYSKRKKILFYFLFDRYTFWIKTKNAIKRRERLFHILQGIKHACGRMGRLLYGKKNVSE